MNDTEVFNMDEFSEFLQYRILDDTGKENERPIYVGSKLMSQLQEVAEQKRLFYDDSPKNNLGDVSNVALQAFPVVRKMDDWEWIVNDDYMYKNKPLKEKLIGNWFLCRTPDGHLFITKDKPTTCLSGSFMIDKHPTEFISGWLCLDPIGGSTFTHGEYQDITRKDFLCLDLPEVTKENPMLEIEIMPSGKVYFYV